MKVCWLVGEIKVRFSRYSHESAHCQHGGVVGCFTIFIREFPGLGVEFKRSTFKASFSTPIWHPRLAAERRSNRTALQDLFMDRQLKQLTTRGVSPEAYCLCKWKGSSISTPCLGGVWTYEFTLVTCSAFRSSAPSRGLSRTLGSSLCFLISIRRIPRFFRSLMSFFSPPRHK